MSVLKFLETKKETLTIKDLTVFFVKEEICEDYRDQILSFDSSIGVKTKDYTINKTGEVWTLVCKETDNQMLFLYSNVSKVVFYNKSVLSHVFLDEIIQVNKMERSFFIIDGLFNNTGQSQMEEYKCFDSIYFGRITKHELFEEVNREYTAQNEERLIEQGLKNFENLPDMDTEALLKEWEQDALNVFLSSKKPREVLYNLKNDYHLITRDFLTEQVVTDCFNYFNEIEQHIEKMKASPEVTYHEIEANFRAFMTQEIYRQNEADWLMDLDLLAVREISRLEQEGQLNQLGRKQNKPIEMEVVLKGEKTKKQAWITSPTVSQGYRFQKHRSPLKFSLKRYAPTNDYLPFDKIEEIYVEGKKVFSYSEFIELMETKKELDMIKEGALEEKTKQETKKAEMEEFKELIVMATEKVSKKSKIIEGQMALNLFF